MARNSLVGRGGGKGGWNFKWYYDTLTPGMAVFNAKFHLAIAAVMEHMAQQVQDYAQENAPWDDRSGAAREGLTADHDTDHLTHSITLYHTVEYGIWLEVRWSGQYAIILPTIETMGPRVMAELQGVMSQV